MQQITFLLTLLSSSVLASVLPARQTQAGDVWQVTDFEASSGPAEPMVYSLNVANTAGSSGACRATNSVTSSDCVGADGPAAFNETACSDGADGSSPSYWSWELDNARSATAGAAPGFSLKITFSAPGAPPLYGCRFIADNTTCFHDPNNPNHASEGLVVPSAFNLTSQENSECVYA